MLPRIEGNLTPRVNKVTAIAIQLAIGLGSVSITSEYLLFALLQEGEGIASVVLMQFGDCNELVYKYLMLYLKKRGGKKMEGYSFDLSFLKVITLAQQQAKLLGHKTVGTEHLLLGLLLSRGTEANKILRTYGLTVPKVRRKILRFLKEEGVTR